MVLYLIDTSAYIIGLIIRVACSATSARVRADHSPQLGSLVATSSRTLLSTSTPRQVLRRSGKLAVPGVTLAAASRGEARCE